MLTFPPIQFAGPFETFVSTDAIDDLAKRYCAGIDGAAHSPDHAQYPEVNAATNRAINDVKAALESGELRAFVNPAGTMEFFLIPAEYWQSVSTDSMLIGEVYSYPHNGLVPKGIRDKPILLRKDEWTTWLSKREGIASLVSQQDRRLPRLPEAKLKKWWSTLSPSDQKQSMDRLLRECRASHPSSSISRQRVRDLDPGRKRGPKPLSGKATA